MMTYGVKVAQIILKINLRIHPCCMTMRQGNPLTLMFFFISNYEKILALMFVS